jgi:thymidylate synthase (FAD)
MRATEHADVEIRALAVECLRQLYKAAPNVFSDFEICTLPDGTEIASSPFVSEG